MTFERGYRHQLNNSLRTSLLCTSLHHVLHIQASTSLSLQAIKQLGMYGPYIHSMVAVR
jgi:hypothetical protein